ncbi:MAG TPA: PorV/PorQ family protein [Candidatus Marinimicrobia bacterium]|jgi:hypothetical protein|nr:PorV/PorQ family protein [Candidatus Neomarinimicrobiota bacterium]
MINTFISKKAVKWAVTFLLVVSFPTLVVAEGADDKVGSVTFKFLNIQTDARSAALGGLTAQGSGAQALFNNPAGIAGSGSSISAGVNQWLVETTIMNAGIVIPMAGGSFGLSFVSVDYGSIMASGWSGTDEFAFNPNAGEFQASDMAIGASYAVSMSDKFKLGVTAKIIMESIEDYNASGYALDIGSQFDTGYKGIRMGATISNFGPDVDPQGEFNSMALPQTFNFGIVGQAFGDENMGLVAGLNVVKTADMAQEFILNGEFAVAGMAKFQFSYNMAENHRAPMSIGAGLNVAGIAVNLAMTSTENLDSIMRISVGASF